MVRASGCVVGADDVSAAPAVELAVDTGPQRQPPSSATSENSYGGGVTPFG
ncbi:MAG: hypothetical protein ACYDEB_09030 [Dehalococcoidia bacterium]